MVSVDIFYMGPAVTEREWMTSPAFYFLVDGKGERGDGRKWDAEEREVAASLVKELGRITDSKAFEELDTVWIVPDEDAGWCWDCWESLVRDVFAAWRKGFSACLGVRASWQHLGREGLFSLLESQNEELESLRRFCYENVVASITAEDVLECLGECELTQEATEGQLREIAALAVKRARRWVDEGGMVSDSILDAVDELMMPWEY